MTIFLIIEETAHQPLITGKGNNGSSTVLWIWLVPHAIKILSWIIFQYIGQATMKHSYWLY